jgi:hypothetical protein
MENEVAGVATAYGISIKALWEILGAIVLTILIMAFIKLFQPREWTPKKRRKTNTLLAMPLAGLLTIWLYDQTFPAKDFTVVFVMFANAGLYSWLADLSEKKRDSGSIFWSLMYYLLRPYDKLDST